MVNRLVSKKPLIYIMDEHNSAFYYWQKAKHQNFFSQPLDLFHIDAHYDLAVAGPLKRSLYIQKKQRGSFSRYYKNLTDKELGIDSFILPAILCNLVKNIYFVPPVWAGYPVGTLRGSVASLFGEGKTIKCQMGNKKNNDVLKKIYPDKKNFFCSTVRFEKLPKKKRVILDIDLDYFACVETIQNHLSYELEITKQQFFSKKQFLQDKKTRNSNLSFVFVKREGKYFVQISHSKVKEKACLPSKQEIEKRINEIVQILVQHKIKPIVTTICTSGVSGYCPPGYGKYITPILINKLKEA